MQRLRRAVLALALLMATPVAAAPVQLTLDQARSVAQQAHAAGDFALANALARRLLQANPQDAQALLLLAATEPYLGNPAAGQRAGRAAWGVARKTPVLRYEIARHTAYAALAEGRPGLAQAWLRRAADTAPTTDALRQTIADFRAVRARNPLRLGFDLAIAPSSNLNGGAQGGLLVIDGDYVLGTLSGAAQALSGVRTVLQARLSYALPGTGSGHTTLGLRFFGTLNQLSAEARALAPGLRGSDLDQVLLEASVARDFLWPGRQHPVSLTLAGGHTWVGGQPYGPHLRLAIGTALRQSRTGDLRLLATREAQWQGPDRVDALALALEGRQIGAAGGQLGWSLGLRDVRGTAVNQDYRGASAEVSYTPPLPLGPVRLRARLSGALRDYPSYRLGPFAVTAGRQDQQVAVALDLTFPAVGFRGYAPKLSLSASETHSNISRFQTRELGLMLGFESQF